MERISLIAMLVAIVSIPLYMFLHIYSDVADDSLEAHYVGREKCIECHLNEYNDWVGSDHDKAMDHANGSTVLGDFNNQSIQYNGLTHEMYKRDGKFFVLTDGETGKLQEFEVKFVFGYYPLQQYLVEFDKGRLQTLPITWDSKDHRWYHMAQELYKDGSIEYNNWLHWSNQAQNWNGMCADCHSTHVKKGYDINTDSYHTTYSEIDVSCETCHGPASNHLKWAAKAEYARSEADNYGLVVKTSGIDNKEYVDLCVRCHSRRSSIGDFIHHADIYNHTIPNLPSGESYHIDGQILDEDYVYASFTQSKMYMRDVKCNDCHNVHSTKRLYEDNRLCTQCHRADDYDTYNHHFHKSAGESGEAVIATDGVKFEVGEGTRCINCHMPAQFYMGVDYRNDHSMRIPRPDLTKTLGTPNACNQCHADKSVDWAIQYVNKWHGIGRPYQYGIAFHEAESASDNGFTDLVRIYRDETYPEIVRATTLQYLGMYYPDRSKDILLDAIGNSNGHIRYNALHNLNITDDDVFKIILGLLTDQTAAIRIESANKLSSIDPNQIPQKYKEAFQKANKEYLAMMEYNADFPTGKFNLANYYYNANNIPKAQEFYEKALQQDSLLHPVKVNLAILYYNQQQYNKAEKMFKDYLSFYPEDGNTLFSYALFLSDRKQYDQSLEMLVKAAKYAPDNARIAYNTAMMFDFKQNFSKAEEYLKRSIQISSGDSNYYVALLNLYVKYQQSNKVKSIAQTILQKFPDLQDREQLEALLK